MRRFKSTARRFYEKTQSGEVRNSGLADSSYKSRSGGFISTVEDLAKFAIAMQAVSLYASEHVPVHDSRDGPGGGVEDEP